MRELAVLHPALALRYLELAAAVAPAVESGLSPCVLANRVARSSTSPPSLRLASWRAERAAFANRLRSLGRESACLVFADVRDCYGSIPPDVVQESLLLLGCDPVASAAVGSLVARLADRGGRGLPVGPAASAVLANAVLARVDDALARSGIRHLRWVDDVVACAEGPAHAERILELLRATLAGLGLELNETKTRVVADPAASHRGLTVSTARAGAPVG